jgi:glycine/D-amino acid oxidase-like deaminating enzyme
LPDSLPIIDRVCEGKVLLAFGHQHLGLTQAAVTAERMVELAASEPAESDLATLAPFRLDRF